jgi:hypothetical protein
VKNKYDIRLEMSITINHIAGFFSCCSVRLDRIVEYINRVKKYPDVVDTSQSYTWYKIDTTRDITYDYFLHYDNIDIPVDSQIYYNHNYQFIDYTKLDYGRIVPLIYKYFSPSEHIQNIIKSIEDKYRLNYDNICVLFYRGNDKNRETHICEYEDYIQYAREILKENPDIQFLIQSDETEFIKCIQNEFPDCSFYFKDETRHICKCNSTVDIVMKNENDVYSKYYLGITIIMSKCKYIVCGSGNCSIWIMFYRENNIGVWQNLNGKWIVPS